MTKTTSNSFHRLEMHRAIELFSDYSSKLLKDQDKHLQIEIERLIRTFKSNFFQALIDIHEYYHLMLCGAVEEIEDQCMHTPYSNTYASEISNGDAQLKEEEYYDLKHKSVHCAEITLERDESGLGFSIAGGTDAARDINDPAIYVTRIVPGGAASKDNKLHVNDIILEVNGNDMQNLTHVQAVNILKNSGPSVKMVVQRCSEKIAEEITIKKKPTESFGFSIAGGVGNQHTPNDTGIFVTKIMKDGVADTDGRLQVGHKLVAVRNATGMHSLENVTHDQAVQFLKDSKNDVTLYVIKP